MPDAAARQSVVASLRPGGRDFFAEQLPFPSDWPDAPCGFLQTSPADDGPARVAQLRGWPIVAGDGGYFAACRDPEALADDLESLLTQLCGGPGDQIDAGLVLNGGVDLRLG